MASGFFAHEGSTSQTQQVGYIEAELHLTFSASARATLASSRSLTDQRGHMWACYMSWRSSAEFQRLALMASCVFLSF